MVASWYEHVHILRRGEKDRDRAEYMAVYYYGNGMYCLLHTVCMYYSSTVLHRQIDRAGTTADLTHSSTFSATTTERERKKAARRIEGKQPREEDSVRPSVHFFLRGEEGSSVYLLTYVQ